MAVPELHDEAVPTLARGVKLRHDQARDAWVLLAPERVLMLDEIALEILKRCDGRTTLGAMVDDLSQAFSADRAEVATDVHAFLRDLAERGFISL